MKLYQSWR